MKYPCWRYHRSHGGKIIRSEAEESPEWFESYGDAGLTALDRDGVVVFEKIGPPSPEDENKTDQTYREHMAAWPEKKKPGRPKKVKE